MKGAWVTLATNDSYSLGALVLAHSLKQVGTTKELAILVTPGVTNSMRTRLSEVFNLVKEVNVLDSRDESNLRLLQRPELGITFTKLHCWRLTQYEKCVFLDADTLVLQNCDELFDREEFSAAPDVGWPDCFNSGVFVYKPSGETYDKLIQFALEKGSFDGGDQGLLNLYFSDWAHKDISKHLPFIYNVCSTAFYSYLPAFKQFGKDVKILHFIGNAKPWLQYFDTETRKVRPSGDVGHLSNVLQRWWDIFCHIVHPSLSPDMSGLAGAFAKLILGQHRTPEQEALESSLRRQNWEQGNIDYLGKDSFDNIWSKICETLSKGPTEEAAGEPQVVSLATTAIPNVAAEQQAPKERPSSQDIATAAETPKEEQQAGETKESSVTPLPVEEIDTTKREEAVCVLPISKKDNEVPLELTPSSGTPSQLPTETPVVFATAPAIPTEIVPPPLLSTSTKSDDVQVTKEKELPPSTFLHTEKKADIDSTATSIETPEVVSSPTNILQENISLQSQLPVKTNETLPMMPQAPTKLEEAIQVISVSEKTSENLVDSCVVQQKESAKSESAPNVTVASMPQSLNNAQTPALVEKVISAQTSPAPLSQCSDAQDSHLVQTLPSHVQTPTTQILTPIYQTPSQEQSSDLSPITPLEDISPTKQTSSVEQTSFPQQTTPQAPISSAIQALPTQSPVEVIAPSALCAEIPIGAVSPQITSPEKTSAPSTKPADTPLHLESASVKETATKDSQTSQPHDSAASSHVASETKQAISSPSANVEAACPIAPPPRKSGGSKKQGKSKK